MKVWICVLFFFVAFTEVNSHNRSESFSVWKVNSGSITGVITLPTQEATRIPFNKKESESLADRFAKYVRNHIEFYTDQTQCELSSPPRKLRSNSSFVRLEIRFDCRNSSPSRMVYTGLFEYSPSHLHYARLSFEGENLAEKLFQSKSVEWDFRQESETTSRSGSGFFSFVVAGIEHIGTGIDHIAFLLALLLSATRWREILISVTGFTIGHSLTLSIAVLGKIKPDTNGIEAFIGLTILIISAEYVRSRTSNPNSISILVALLPSTVGFLAWLLNKQATHILFAYLGMSIFTISYLSLNPYLTQKKRRGFYLGIATVVFGMIHGFGFAGFLLETGLEKDRLIEPLFGFNLGVEIGQLLLVLSALLIGFCLRKTLFPKIDPRYAKLAPLLLLFLLSALGAYWFVQRSF
ncbi:HupE/UreJ family protein [Leptospira kmetyi]|uniref:HupE/UreJ family protein n=1 Tax=Leptospira kmetyi TaxID=408139 RepID=UPI00108236F7|nr:HupE/UreJ family protein [Leptospira kmetyi]TGK12977.1 HupE/UreJ family protein [Leptospira kmetyi]TGK34737.1 HupE/UreJ family protein [Leptospira kmetyi]